MRSATPLVDSLAPGAALEDDANILDEDLDMLASSLSLHKAADRSIPYAHDLPVVGSKKRGLKELAEDLQSTIDWLEPLLTDEPNLGAAITTIVEAAVASALANRRQSATLHLANPTALVNADPAIHEIPIAATATVDGDFRIMHVFEFESPALLSLFVLLSWTSTLNLGTGVTKWMLSEVAESVGLAPSGSAKDVTDEIVANTSKDNHSRSGTVPVSALPSGDFRLMLVGKPESPGGILTATLFNASTVELSY